MEKVEKRINTYEHHIPKQYSNVGNSCFLKKLQKQKKNKNQKKAQRNKSFYPLKILWPHF